MKFKIFLTSICALVLLTGCQTPSSTLSSTQTSSSKQNSSLTQEQVLIKKLHATRDRFETIHNNEDIYNANISFDIDGTEYIYASNGVTNIDTSKILEKTDWQIDGNFVANIDLQTANKVKEYTKGQEPLTFPDDNTELRLDFAYIMDTTNNDGHSSDELVVYYNDNRFNVDMNSNQRYTLVSDSDIQNYYSFYNGVYDKLIDCLSVNSVDDIYSYMKVLVKTVFEYVMSSSAGASNSIADYSELINALIAFISSPDESREEAKTLIIEIIAAMTEADVEAATIKFGTTIDNILVALEKVDFDSFISSKVTNTSIKIFINFGAVQKAIGLLYNAIQHDLLDLVVEIQGNDNMTVEQAAQLRAAASILISQYLVLINSIISTFELSFTMGFTEDLLTSIDVAVTFYMPSEYQELNKEPVESFIGYDFKLSFTFDMKEGKTDIESLIA